MSGSQPQSQPLSVAFGAEKKAGKGFSAQSEAPRSNKPLPSRADSSSSTHPESKAGKKAPAPSGFPLSEFGDDDK
jgi:hypothetical protein